MLSSVIVGPDVVLKSTDRQGVIRGHSQVFPWVSENSCATTCEEEIHQRSSYDAFGITNCAVVCSLCSRRTNSSQFVHHLKRSQLVPLRWLRNWVTRTSGSIVVLSANIMQFELNGRNNNIEHRRRAIIGAMRKSGVVYYRPVSYLSVRRQLGAFLLRAGRLFDTVTPSIDWEERRNSRRHRRRSEKVVDDVRRIWIE